MLGQTTHALPRRSVFLTAPTKRAAPKPDDVMAEGIQAAAVGGYSVVLEKAPHHAPQPGSLLGYRDVPATPQLLVDLTEFAMHALGLGVPRDQVLSAPRLRADVPESEEAEGLGFPFSARRTLRSRIGSEANQARFLGMQFQVEASKPSFELCLECSRGRLVLEADDEG